MGDMTNLFEAAKFQGVLAENQDLFEESNTSNARCHKGFSRYPDEVSNKLEKEYYERASGCSVKAQENNIFDYQVYSKKQ